MARHSHESDLSDLIMKLTAIGERKLLVVDDDAAIRNMIAGLLEHLGSVETAANGREALDQVKDNFFDVIISDIGMPVMNGMEFYQKAVDFNPDTNRQFVFCTGNISSEIINFLNEYHLPYLEKPFKLNQLLETVYEVINNDRQA